MATMIPDDVGAGLATRGARIMLILVWVMGILAVQLDGRPKVLAGVIGVISYLLPLVGGILVTSRTPGPLSRGRALVVLTAVILVAVSVLAFLDLSHQRPGGNWLFSVNSFLAVLLVIRGHPVIGGIGTTAIVALGLGWGVGAGQRPEDLAALLLPAVSAAIVGAIWVVVLRLVARHEHADRARAAQEDATASAAEADAQALRVHAAQLLRIAQPPLGDLVAGRTIDAAFLRQLWVAEGGIRDRIRAPDLQHPMLSAAVDAARARGADVLLLGGDPDPGAVLTETLARQLSAFVARAQEITIQVRAAGVVSVLIRPTEGPAERVLLNAQGERMLAQELGM